MANRGPRAYLDELRHAVMQSSGVTSLALRAQAATGIDVPAALDAVIQKIRRHAYKITSEDIAELRASGRSDDEIFELTCAAALGVAIDRCDKAFAACGLSGAPDRD